MLMNDFNSLLNLQLTSRWMQSLVREKFNQIIKLDIQEGNFKVFRNFYRKIYFTYKNLNHLNLFLKGDYVELFNPETDTSDKTTIKIQVNRLKLVLKK